MIGPKNSILITNYYQGVEKAEHAARMGRQDTRICVGGFDSSGSEQGQVAGSFEHGKERRNSIQGVEFLDSLSNYRLLKYDTTTAR